MPGGAAMSPAASRLLRARLAARYPGADIRVRRDFGGGLRASVTFGDHVMHFSVGDRPGVLSAVLGIDGPDGGPHDGGGAAGARLTA